MFGHLVGDVEIEVSRSFDFEEASTVVDSTVGFDNDGLRVTVYKLKGASDSVSDSEGG